MKTEDIELIQNHPGRQTAGTAFELVLTRDARSRELETFVRTMEEQWPALAVVRTRSDEDGPPCLDLGDGLRFQGLPEGTKLAPFLDALASNLEPPVDEHGELLAGMALTVELRLYVADPCPFCPQVVRQWAALARSGPHLGVRIVDGALFPEDVERDGIQAVPTLVLDRDWRWSGDIPVRDVLRQMVDRDPSKFSARALEGLLKEGRASALATVMRQHGSIFPAFVDLLTHPKWPIRLGAMVTMEALIEADPGLSETIVPMLMRRFAHLDEQAQGDALYVLGQTGNRQTLAQIQALPLDGAGDELRQAVREAVESIAARRQ